MPEGYFQFPQGYTLLPTGADESQHTPFDDTYEMYRGYMRDLIRARILENEPEIERLEIILAPILNYGDELLELSDVSKQMMETQGYQEGLDPLDETAFASVRDFVEARSTYLNTDETKLTLREYGAESQTTKDYLQYEGEYSGEYREVLAAEAQRSLAITNFDGEFNFTIDWGDIAALQVEYKKAVDLPPLASFTDIVDISGILSAMDAGDVRDYFSALETLGDEGDYLREQLDQKIIGDNDPSGIINTNLLEILGSPFLLTEFGIVNFEYPDDAEINSVMDYDLLNNDKVFSTEGGFLPFVLPDENAAANMISSLKPLQQFIDESGNVQEIPAPRSDLMFLYKWIQAFPDIDPLEVATSDEYQEAFSLFGVLSAEVDQTLPINNKINQDLIKSVFDDSDISAADKTFVRSVFDITTTPSFLDSTQIYNGVGSTNVITSVGTDEYNVWINGASAVIDGPDAMEFRAADYLSRTEVYKDAYLKAKTSLSFADWADQNITTEEIEVGLSNTMGVGTYDPTTGGQALRDLVFTPVVDALVRGMPSHIQVGARKHLFDTIRLRFEQSYAGFGEEGAKERWLNEVWTPDKRKSAMQTYFYEGIIQDPNVINGIADAGIDIVDFVRNMITQEADPGQAGELFEGVSEDSTEREFYNALLKNLETTGLVPSDVFRTASFDEQQRKIRADYTKLLKPHINALKIPDLFHLGIIDDYIKRSFTDNMSPEDQLKTLESTVNNDFDGIALLFIKDVFTNFASGDRILKKINEEYGGNAMEYILDNGLSTTSDGVQHSFLSLESAAQDTILTMEDDVKAEQELLGSLTSLADMMPPEAITDATNFILQYARSAAQRRGMDFADYVKQAVGEFTSYVSGEAEVAPYSGEITAQIELFLNEQYGDLFTDDYLENLVAASGFGSKTEFFEAHKDLFTGTRTDIKTALEDFELMDVAPGEDAAQAAARAAVAESKAKLAADEQYKEALDDVQKGELELREARLQEDKEREERAAKVREGEFDLRERGLEENQATQERDFELAEIRRQEAERQAHLVDPFEQAFRTQASRFLFGPRGREVASYAFGDAFTSFEERINVTRDRFNESDAPTYAQLFSGEFPEVGGSVDDYVGREFDAGFFSEAARKERQSRTPAARGGVARQSRNPLSSVLGARGGR